MAHSIPSPLVVTASLPTLDLCCPGHVPYATAWEWQKHRVQLLQHHPERPDGLLLLTHPPVYTLGQGSALKFLRGDLDPIPFEIHRTERGGEVTYHGPGQWVGYPILNLKRHQTDLHWYLRQLEQVVIDVLADLDLPGERISGLTGVWLQGSKVAAVGIRVRRWISFHGFSLNVCPDLDHYQAIIPCGIADRPVGSLAQFQPDLTLEQVQPLIVQAFCRRFRLIPRPISAEHWLTPTDTSEISP